jgi:alkanesulfonate monooxygenase SsuD/methylene tetrahydromethanopterin reductase-like flavin-dependent oxidoreductase (luciferase family)
VTRKPVSVGIHVPSVAVAPLGSGEAYAEFFRQVEELGLDGIWTEDRLFHSANLLDSVVLLAWAAANTRRIQLGTAVMVLNLRHAAVVARQASTLAHLSGGRLALGVSLGGRPNEYQGLGVPVERRVRVFHSSYRALHFILAHDRILTERAANTIMLPHAILAQSIMRHRTERLRFPYQR